MHCEVDEEYLIVIIMNCLFYARERDVNSNVTIMQLFENLFDFWLVLLGDFNKTDSQVNVISF